MPAGTLTRRRDLLFIGHSKVSIERPRGTERSQCRLWPWGATRGRQMTFEVNSNPRATTQFGPSRRSLGTGFRLADGHEPLAMSHEPRQTRLGLTFDGSH